MENQDLKMQASAIKSALERAMESIELTQIPFTKWAVLLRHVDGKWEPVECVNTDNMPEHDLEFDLILPIPAPEGTPEFNGF